MSPGADTDGETATDAADGRGPAGDAVRTAREVVSNTAIAVRTALGRRDALLLAGVVTVGYLVAYLYALGHLSIGPVRGLDLLVVRDPMALLFRQTGPLEFEAVARLTAGPVALLIAPVTIAIGAGLAGLVGLNLALSYLAWRQPAACGIAAGAGPLAALPGLFSGAACCGPALLAVLGIQASSLLLSVFGILIPAAAVALVLSLLWVGRRVDPDLLAAVDGDAGGVDRAQSG